MGRPQKHSEEFKAEAVRLIERSGRTVVDVARDLGLSYWSLRQWYKEAQVAKGSGKTRRKAAAALGPVKGESLEEKVARLERENEELRKKNEALEMDREILKKAAAFFAKESE